MSSYKEGLYFNMPFSEYIAIEAFNRGMAEDITVSYEEAWGKSWMNPDKEENYDSPQMQLGRQVHSKILEPKVFDKEYVAYPEKPEGALETCDDLKAVIKEFNATNNEKLKISGSKAELMETVKSIKPDAIIWQEVYDKWLKENEGKEILNSERLKLLDKIQASFNRNKYAVEMVKEGYSEVTILWKENGLLCKARLDWLGPDRWVDLKTFSLKRKKPIEQAVADEIKYNKYHWQYYVYQEALGYILRKIKAGKAEMHGDIDDGFKEKLLRSFYKECGFIFVRTDPYYQVRIPKPYSGLPGATNNEYFDKGKEFWQNALAKYHFAIRKWGTDPWIDEDTVFDLEDHHFGMSLGYEVL